MLQPRHIEARLAGHVAEEVEVLTGGQDAIDGIVGHIEDAGRSIDINMFIWRDDAVGNRICRALLRAANRGVRVRIAKDKLGAIFELGEENRQSLFHKNHDLLTAVRQRVINAYSSSWREASYSRQRPNELGEYMQRHPNIRIDADVVRGDHSKCIVVDERVLIFGGVNFEDRAVSKDILGLRWADYTIVCRGEKLVRRLRDRQAGEAAGSSSFEFLLNDVRNPARFEIKPEIIRLLVSARQSCRIEMAYLGDRDITQGIIETANRGVDVSLLIPAIANIQHDLNFSIASRIYRRTNGKIAIYLSPDMLHAKMIDVDESVIVVGSANFNVRALASFAELNARISGDTLCATTIRESFEQRRVRCLRVTDPAMLSYSSLKAGCELIFG